MSKPKFDKKQAKAFFYWINERHQIYVNRKAGMKWPWTKDKILQTYRFCNVFRELDTVTKWIRKNWRKPYKNHKNLWFSMALARQINWPPTLKAIGFPKTWKPKKVAKKMKAIQDRGEKVYTGAYMLVALKNEPSKIDQTVHTMMTSLWKDPVKLTKKDNLQSAFNKFKKYIAFGDFLSYEIVTDLRHTRYLRHADDIMTWANAGPGAIRGVQRIWGIKVLTRKEKNTRKSERASSKEPIRYNNNKRSAEWYLEKMQYLLKISPKYLGKHVPALEMRDIEHSLCEFDKYSRVKLGEGRPRAKYRPPEE